MIKILPFSKELGALHDGVRGWLGGNPEFEIVKIGEPFDFIWFHAWGDAELLDGDMNRARRLGRCIFVIQGDRCYVPFQDDGCFYFVTHMHTHSAARQWQVPYSHHASLAWYRENKGSTFDKKYLASFMGSFQTNPDRRRLTEICGADVPVIERDGWQLSKMDDETHQFGIREHSDLIAQSDFTLCPRGIGKTSIRVVEAIMRDSLPVLIDDETCPFGDKMEFAMRFPMNADMKGLRFTLQCCAAHATGMAEDMKAMRAFRDEFLLRDERDGCPNDLGWTGFILDKVKGSG